MLHAEGPIPVLALGPKLLNPPLLPGEVAKLFCVGLWCPTMLFCRVGGVAEGEALLQGFHIIFKLV